MDRGRRYDRFLFWLTFIAFLTAQVGYCQTSSLAPSNAPVPQTSNNANSESAGASQTVDNSNVFVFRKEVQEVILHAAVDQDGRPVSNLDQNSFAIYDNGELQKITSFDREDVAIALGILVDNSGSMLDKRPQISKAVLNLIQSSNPRDEVFVVNFGQYPYLDQDFTTDTNLLEKALLHVSQAGSTALYDAVAASSIHIANHVRENKRVLLLITDGQDNMSVDTLQQAIRVLEEKNGPIVYAIALTGGGFSDAGRDALISLTRATGGYAFFPLNIGEVDAITRQIAHDIRIQYNLSYKPSDLNTRSNAFHTVKVIASSPQDGLLNVRTRTGYYANELPH